MQIAQNQVIVCGKRERVKEFLKKALKTGGHKGILCVYLLSLPVRGAWIEIANANGTIDGILSLPVRGAWIEIEP